MNQQFDRCGLSRVRSWSSHSGKTAARILALSMSLTAVATVIRATDVSASGPVSFDQTEFNFGQLAANSAASHTFWIRASGPDTIVIDTVIPGCGCTTIPLSKTKLAPGDSVAFEIVFDSKGLLGSVAKKPGFRLRGDSVKYSFKFYASVVTKETEFFPMAIMPPVFALPEEEARSGKEFPFQLNNSSDEDISVTIVDFPAELFSVDLPDSIPAGKTINGRFSLHPGYPEGKDIYKSITFEANHSQLYRLTAPIVMKSTPVKSSGIDPTSDSSADTTTADPQEGP